MKRLLLLTTALTVLSAPAAIAQQSDSGMSSEMGTPFFTEGMDAVQTSGEMYFSASSDQFLTTHIIGQTIHNGIGEDAEAIGDVNDIILAPDGSAEAVVIGVGGFLGIGEKLVAIAFDNIHVQDVDGATWLTVDANREDLEAAPTFDPAAIESDFAARTAMGDPMAEGSGTYGEEASPMNDSMDVDVMGGNSDEQLDVARNEGEMEPSAQGTANDAGMTLVEIDAVSANDLIGARTYAANDQDIGEIGDVILNDEGGIDAYIVDVGGFLGIGEKPVAVAAAELEILRDQNGWLSVHTDFSREQLENQPEFDREAYDTNPGSVVLQ